MKNRKSNNFISPLHLACDQDKDTLRPVFSHVHFSNNNAYATNGNMIIRQPLNYSSVINYENLNGKMIHKDVFKDILKYDIVKATPEGLECSNDKLSVFIKYSTLEASYQVPNFEEYLNNENAYESVEKIGINPRWIDIANKILVDEYGNNCDFIEFIRMQFFQLVKCP